MVSPFYLLLVGLGLGFLLGLLGKKFKQFTAPIITLAFGYFTYFSISWIIPFLNSEITETIIYTAGFKPPFAISLAIGMNEIVISLVINLLGFLSSIYLWNRIKNDSVSLGTVLLVLIMTLNLIVFTRDLFNIFVWLEIIAISSAGLILLDKNKLSFSAGFKYLLASSIISSLYLLGVVLIYFTNGTLFLDDLLSNGILTSAMSVSAIFLVLIALIIELKPFPANGWALDIYEGANPAIGALMSGVISTAILFVFYKLLILATPQMFWVFTLIGILTFLFSNLMALVQNNPNRLLGYSSISQIGLTVAILSLKPIIGANTEIIAFGILIAHAFAKTGLFWISGIINGNKLEDWAAVRTRPFLLVLFGVFIFALSAFPPFPSFYAKWELMLALANHGQYFWMLLILLGSMLEAVYLFRWLGIIVKAEIVTEENITLDYIKLSPPIFSALILIIAGYFSVYFMSNTETINYLPLLAVVVLWAIDFLPVWVKNTLLIAAVVIYSYFKLPLLHDFNLIFGIIFMAGAILTLLYGYSVKGKRPGFYPIAAMMYAGLITMVEASTLFSFFFAWEIMTVGSYFLILRGKNSQPHALSYMLFSVGGALLLLAGFTLAHSITGSFSFDAFVMNSTLSPWIFLMITIGFLTKTASLGLHIWLPGAHSEAEADVSPMVSGILLKAGVFGLIILFLRMGHQYIYGIDLMYILSWLGVATAIGGNLMASFQEDMKRLLAYSSVGQLGYILFGLSLMSHLGWLLALSASIMHFMYKTMLFQAIGGVYSRTHERRMYRLGGLIFQMPMTFIVVLIGIIALSGVPPLAGFAGKWISFNAVLQQQYYLQGAAMVIAGAIAFLYLFRLIHAPFLGQLKDNLRHVKEASFWILLPQYIIITLVMAFSAIPGLLLERLGTILIKYFPEGGLTWVNSAISFGARTAISQYGYWNGTYVMIISMGIFIILLLVQWLTQRNNKKVGQFNIVYSGERPSSPETTHFAYNFYAHYNKAIGFLTYPFASMFWNKISNLFHDIANQTRLIYDGNGQSYLIHIMLFFLVSFYILFGGI
ncbi:MAG TPA: NADH-quinone oxidoreductase subunit F [Bacteroidales bacterium]|nr:NADH-quinone oxidoreductase subunit F [Bacteroidales bacterium]